MVTPPSPYGFSVSTAHGNEGGVIDWARGQGGWPGAKAAPDTQIEEELTRERVHSGPTIASLPWFLPFFDDQQTLHENQAMRLAYRQMLADPIVKGAMLGKLLAVCARKVKVIPAGKGKSINKRLQLKYGREADFLRWNLLEALDGGMPGLIWSILSGAMVDGYSLCEKVWGREDSGEFQGAYFLKAVKPKDTGHDVIIKTDPFRNVSGIMGLRYNAGLEFNLSHFVYYKHLPMWGVPTGISDFRACYGSWWFRTTARKLRMVGLEKRSYPLLWATYENTAHQPLVDKALLNARSQSFFSVPKGVMVEALNVAGSAQADYESAIDNWNDEIVVSIQGATLQMMEGNTTDGRGDSQVHQNSAELRTGHLVHDVESVFNGRNGGLARDILDLNCKTDAYPQLRLGGVDADERDRELDQKRKLFDMGLSLSADAMYEQFDEPRPDENNPEDALSNKPPEQPGGEMPGMPGPDDQPLDAGAPPEEETQPDEEQPGPFDFRESLDFDAYAEAWSAFAAARKDGETWTTGNRRYERSGGKTTWKSTIVKAAPKEKPPGGDSTNQAKKTPAAPKAPTTKKAPAAKVPIKLKAKKLTVEEAHRHLTELRTKPVTPDTVKATVETLMGMNKEQIREARAKRGMKKGSGRKEELARQLVEETLKGLETAKPAEQKASVAPPEEKQPEEPKPEANAARKKAFGSLMDSLRSKEKVTDSVLEDALEAIEKGTAGLTRQEALAELDLPPQTDDYDMMEGMSKRALGSKRETEFTKKVNRKHGVPTRTGAEADQHLEDRIEYGLQSSTARDTQRRAYAQTTRQVFAAMPRKARDLVASHVEDLSYHGSLDGVKKDFMSKVSAKVAEEFERKGSTVGGFYTSSEDRVVLDGGWGGEAKKTFGIKGDVQREIYAHEFTHAIDGPHFVLSSSPEWGAIHSGEMANAALTEYANVNTKESFAEFGRLVYGGRVSLDDVADVFPEAAAFFRQRGLWPEQGGESKAELLEVFDPEGRLELDDGTHSDSLLKGGK